jgi:hypothetical protein
VASVVEFFEAAAEQQQRIDIQGNAIASCDRSMARRAITNPFQCRARRAARFAHPGSPACERGGGTAYRRERRASHSPEELHCLFARFARGAERPAATADGTGWDCRSSIDRDCMAAA